MVRLQELILSGNNLIGTLPALLNEMTELQKLLLHKNRLGGTLPADMFYSGTTKKGLVRLLEFSVAENLFKGKLPSMEGMHELRTFAVNNNEFEDFPKDMDHLTKLQQLHLHSNKINAELPITFAKLTALRDIAMGDNKIKGRLPETIGNLRYLVSLKAPNNLLENTLPSSIETCKELEELDLSQNFMNGDPPFGALGHLVKFRALVLSHNRFNGVLSESVKLFKKLEVLQLDDNEFSGALPGAALGQLGTLKRLALGNNRFDGVIPSELSAMTSLEDLQLQKNRLKGRVPSIFCKSDRTLPAINVTDNQLLECYDSCLTKNERFFHSPSLVSCAFWKPPTSSPVSVPTAGPPSAAPPTATGLSGKTQARVVLYLASTLYASTVQEPTIHADAIKTAMVKVINDAQVTAGAIVGIAFFNDASGSQDDDGENSSANDDAPSARTLRVSLRSNAAINPSRALASTPSVRVSMYIATNAASVTFASLKKTIEAAVPNMKLTTEIRMAGKSLSAQGMSSLD